ncbi:Hypothetical protein HP17_01533 [Helicobacter pylori NCTC 11637 = CCUG 17874 = ATCC 43504 = JCM 12093]|nr:Hypothetical protein HP17_01533 [Helicobacter pylori NCTC 11637 = CCUG 17874 = ATCC 43504 = JCM 12093]
MAKRNVTAKKKVVKKKLLEGLFIFQRPLIIPTSLSLMKWAM